jgi:uncharacterized delta-60 repeat protein
MRRALAPILTVAVVTSLPAAASAAPGRLDPAFGSKGRVTASFGGASVGAGMDTRGGRIAVAGTAQGADDDLGVLVLTSAGALDPTFSGDGRATAGFDGAGASDDLGRDVAIDGTGRIVAVGDVGGADGAVAVWDAAGRRDRSFASSGRLRLDLGDDEGLAAVAIDPEGRIVVAGTGGAAGNLLLVARLTADGELDPAFSGDGWVVTNLGNSVTTRGLTLQGSSPVVVGKIAATTGSDGFVARFTPGGTLDPTFSGDGTVIEDFSTGFDELVDVVTDGSGAIAVGRAGDDLAVVRYTSSGGRDGSFSGDGLATLAVGDDLTRGTGVAVAADGRVVVAATATDSFSVHDQVAIRLTAAGAPDTSFSGDGIKRVSYAAGTPDDATDAAVTPKGRILVAGWAGSSVTVTALLS